MKELSFGPVAPPCVVFPRTSCYRPGPGALLALLLLAVVVWIDMQFLRVTFRNVERPVAIVGVPLLLAFYGQARALNCQVVSGCRMLGIFFGMFLSATILQYLFAIHGAGRELVDQRLLAIDHALGLDPATFTALWDRSAIACDMLFVIYNSLHWQMAIIIVALLFLRDYETFDALVISMIALIFIGSAIAAAAPAIGFTGVSDIGFTNTAVAGGRVGQSNFLALRSGLMPVIDLDDMPGIITFPSGHAALGMLMILVARGVPYALWPFTILNLAMLPSIIVHGGHYFADIIAGVLIMLVFWPLARRLAAGGQRLKTRQTPTPPLVGG
ncbi:MAG: phosphatase PAP2 family protein [Methylocystis sp.]|uniref:phosphatase PAP2 family protein n=1 Tax=Methylocystis sp. TaxID=1911079 RepID=UPI003DA3447E